MLNIILKVLLVALLLYVIVNLFRGLFSVLSNDPNRLPMSHFIGRRVLFSVVVMLLVIVALSTGVLEPNPRPYP
ncbi:MAG: protein of unknown function DUF2909 [Idiomarinaceae bacterium HL-53]|nr:MAG: protein of unknown function DUF2909 [Idiomarinaceae bacterium HL-53]CUS47591.1 Protein of unknown function (DUF2909) [Idiomarinaceae bacterium HL-53]